MSKSAMKQKSSNTIQQPPSSASSDRYLSPFQRKLHQQSYQNVGALSVLSANKARASSSSKGHPPVPKSQAKIIKPSAYPTSSA